MAFAFLRRWLRLAPKPRPDLRVVVFTRAACPLCDKALELLRGQQRRYGFTLELRDIDNSAELVRAYGECVPVVTINGQVRFRGQVNEVLLRRILDSH
jgi:glutaredoxin